MKKILCFTIVLCITLGSLTAQQNYFIAGDTSGVLYYDIEPDFWLPMEKWGNTYKIDIDFNGTDDFAIKTDVIISHNYEIFEIIVNSYGSNMVGYSDLTPFINPSGDTSYLLHEGIGLGNGDTINEDILFTYGSVYLKGYEYGNFGSFSANWTPGDYIPVCLIPESSSDCIYGWIKVYDVSLSYGITLDSYAVDISQYCLTEGITFETQAQIDSFQINYPYCTEIEGDVQISGDDITSLNGLSVLTSVGGSLDIKYNDTLTSLTGLDNVMSIGGDLRINDNPALTSLTGLGGLVSIEGDLWIGQPLYGGSGNPLLTSLSALDNLDTIGGAIHIIYNESLSVCDVPLICEYLSDSISKNLEIHHNAQGCDGALEMAYHCGITYPCLTEGSYDLYSQGDVNYFALVYPGCSSLDASVNISGSNITHLDSLNVITSIYGDFKISQTGILDFSGLENLFFISGDLDLVGDYSSYWGGCGPEGNHSLIDLTGLEGLDSIGGYLQINCCISLSSLAELANIESSTIEDLIIIGNYELSDCEVESICAYLANPNGDIEIYDNAIGCNSPEEVQDSCEAHGGIVDERYTLEDCFISPNPFSTSTTLSYSLSKPENVHFTVYNVQSQIVFEMQERQDSGEQKIKWNASGLPAGMYYFRIQAGDKVGGGKKVLLR